MPLKFHAKWQFNVLDEKRIVDGDALRNFYSEQFESQEEPENTQVKTSMHIDFEDRISGQSTTETRNEPEFTSDEFKGHMAKLNLSKAPCPNGMRPGLIVYDSERLHNLHLILF